jgi:hypothetical protein
MSTYAELVNGLIEQRVKKINTLALGKLTSVDLATWKADVLLKSKIQGEVIELQAVPIAVQNFAAGSIHIAPAVGDVVIVGYAKHEVQALLGDKEVQDVNERILHNLNHALIIGGIHTAVDIIPEISSNEILIRHKSGSYLKFKADGSIEIKATDINLLKLS